MTELLVAICGLLIHRVAHRDSDQVANLLINTSPGNSILQIKRQMKAGMFCTLGACDSTILPIDLL